MSTDLDPQLLSGLHSLLRQKTDLTERLEKGPRAIKISENNVANYEQKIVDLKNEIKECKMKADERQLNLDERESHIEKLKTQRNGCDSNREFQLLSDQIAADEQANSVLQDEILEVLEKIEELEATNVKENENLQTLQQESEKVKQRVTSELESVRTDLGSVETEIAEMESQLPTDVRSDLRRLTEAMGEEALSKVEDKTCGHCFQVINTQIYTQLMMNRPVYCGGCGSLMYLPKSQPAT